MIRNKYLSLVALSPLATALETTLADGVTGDEGSILTDGMPEARELCWGTP